jgi:hypothetical protein
MAARIPLPRDKVEAFCRKHHIRSLSLFGSVLRQDFRPDSDVDFLVEFEPQHRHSLFDLVDMQDELEQIVGRRVDLVERSAVEQSSNYIRRKNILSAAEPLYEKR